jgi:RNA polymerase sigma factor (sigma-70 family)
MGALAVDDVRLARRCADGERLAQTELFKGYSRQVHATLYRVLGTNREMEDLVQDAFIEVYRSLPRFRGESKLSTWIDRITARVAFRYLRNKKPVMTHLEAVPEPISGDPSAEHKAILKDATKRLYAVMDELPDKVRIAYALHVIDGRKLREVAVTMNSTLVATKSRVWRGQRQLEKLAKKDPLLSTFVAEMKEGS